MNFVNSDHSKKKNNDMYNTHLRTHTCTRVTCNDIHFKKVVVTEYVVKI